MTLLRRLVGGWGRIMFMFLRAYKKNVGNLHIILMALFKLLEGMIRDYTQLIKR